MKTDKSLYNIAIAAVNRHAIHQENWQYSKIISTPEVDGFDLAEEELPVLLIESDTTRTLVSTRRIIEISDTITKNISISEIEDIIYGNFKDQPNKPSLSIFRTTDMYGDELNFQLETGAASIALMYCINTLRKLSNE